MGGRKTRGVEAKEELACGIDIEVVTPMIDGIS